jgi:hypothetical protein
VSHRINRWDRQSELAMRHFRCTVARHPRGCSRGWSLGFDWHSSGVTTTVCGAVKESLHEVGTEWGLFATAGNACICDRLGREPDTLLHASRTAAKVDNAAVQDGYQLYHHVFFFTSSRAVKRLARFQ